MRSVRGWERVTPASDASLPCYDAAGQSESLAPHQAQTSDPLANVSGGNNISGGRIVHREVRRQVSSVGNVGVYGSTVFFIALAS